MATTQPPAPTPTLPLIPPEKPRARTTISYGQLLQDAARAIENITTTLSKSAPNETLRLTVDFPPERSETRAGTLVSRFENNLNFLYALAERLAIPSSPPPQRIGPPVEIRDNINPQGGGEYLTDDECLIGVRVLPTSSSPAMQQRPITLLLNAGVDASTLRQVKQYDDVDNGVIILVNCALDRVSWFAKVGFAKYLDSFQTAYYLKTIAAGGWLLKCAPAPWSVFINRLDDGPSLLEQMDERPSVVDVEAMIRLNLADLA